MEAEDIERVAVEIYQAARRDPGEPTSIVRLARAVPGIEALEWVPGLRVPARCVANDNGRHVIQLASRLRTSVVAAQWFVAHELAESWLSRPYRLYEEPDRERVCQNIAAALVCPRPALRRKVADFGVAEAIPELAGMFRTSERVVSLRLGEALDYSVALVGELRVRRRGRWYLGTDRELRRAVQFARAERLDGLGRLNVAPLTDPQYTLVFCEENEANHFCD